MKERPIIFSGEMVRAILDGRKTQTRRVVLPKPDERYGAILWGSPRYDNGDGAKYFHTSTLSPSIMKCWADACPFGKEGDRLWVRETWIIGHKDGHGGWSVLRPTGVSEQAGRVFYRASFNEPDPNENGRMLWRSPIHMLRWASRITLEITTVRVERLQEISEADAIAEGFEGAHYENAADDKAPSDQFGDTWNKLHWKTGHSWHTNPWVWVIEFKRVEQRQKAAA